MRRTRAQEWIAKYKAKFDQGWDKLREETLAVRRGWASVPQDTKLAPKPRPSKTGEADRRREEAVCPPDGGVCRYAEYADAEIGRPDRGH